MAEQSYRIERYSLGEVKVPSNALYGAQTRRRSSRDPPISHSRFPCLY